MKHYQDFIRSGQSFEERIGPPEEFDAAMGRIALGFSFLEDTARNVIVLISEAEHTVGCIMTCEMSFRQKLDVLASLVHLRFAQKTDGEHPVQGPDRRGIDHLP